MLIEYLLQDGHVLGSGGVEVKMSRPWPWGLLAVWLSGRGVVGHCRAVASVLCVDHTAETSLMWRDWGRGGVRTRSIV